MIDCQQSSVCADNFDLSLILFADMFASYSFVSWCATSCFFGQISLILNCYAFVDDTCVLSSDFL